MKCPNCGYKNSNMGTWDNRCDQCGYYLLSIKQAESQEVDYFRFDKIFFKTIAICRKGLDFRKGFNIFHFLLIIIFLAIVPPILHSNSKQFDQIVWKTNRDSSSFDNPRSQMLGDLQHHYLKIGMNRQQVRQLLGFPERHTTSIDIYDIGYMGWSALDPSTLELRYNNSDILLQISIIEH